MRLWSLHPKHLDVKGLVALWREGLLARKVLQGRTKGYKRHPQLVRFRDTGRPVEAIDRYLGAVLAEARARGYHFDASKIRSRPAVGRWPVKRGQLRFEWEHLGAKLKKRDLPRWRAWKLAKLALHPSFRRVPGGMESWER